MKKLALFFIFIIVISFASAEESLTITEISTKVENFVEDPVLIVKGNSISVSEKLALKYVLKNYQAVKDYLVIDETLFYLEKYEGYTVVLIGGPTQNSITEKLLQENQEKEQYNTILGVLTFINSNQKYMIFSDKQGYSNLPRTNLEKSPLANFIPIEYVPAAATGISFFLLWLWQILQKIFAKLIKKLLAVKILSKFKKKTLKHEFKGFHLFGMRIKYREWASIFVAAFIFALAISYSYLNKDVFNLILITTTVNIIVYCIRHFTRLFMDRKHKLHTEYHLWLWGAFITIVSGWLGNTFSLAGYVLSDENKKSDKEGKIKYIINLLILFVALIFTGWNFLYPSILIQMSMLMSLSYGFISLLPITPFSGKKIYAWNKLVWWITFIPVFGLYTIITLIV